MKPIAKRTLNIIIEEKEEVTTTGTRPMLRLVQSEPAPSPIAVPGASPLGGEPVAATTAVYQLPRGAQPAAVPVATPSRWRVTLSGSAIVLALLGYAAVDWMSGHGRLTSGERALVSSLEAAIAASREKVGGSQRPVDILTLAKSGRYRK